MEFDRLIHKMGEFFRMPKMLDVDSRISANLRVPVIFRREFINLEEAKLEHG